MNKLILYVNGNRNTKIEFEVNRLINAGYTGRNQAETQKHIDELKAVGVPAPDKIPTYYAKSPQLVTTDTVCHVVDRDSTGEAEYILLVSEEGIYVGVGSDHTDRVLEISNIPKAKMITPNFMSKDVWRLEDHLDSWDEIELRSWIGGNREVLYQETTLENFIEPEKLLSMVEEVVKDGLLPGTMIFSGTVGALVEGMPFSESFEVELYDRKLCQKLVCRYDLEVMDWLND